MKKPVLRGRLSLFKKPAFKLMTARRGKQGSKCGRLSLERRSAFAKHRSSGQAAARPSDMIDRVLRGRSAGVAAMSSGFARTDPSRFSPSLESTRGIAALMVAAYHVNVTPSGAVQNAYFVADEKAPLWQTLHHVYHALCNGGGAVVYFFVLSGFVLATSISSRNNSAPKSFISFSLRRALRIYPANISATLIFVLISLFISDYLRLFYIPSFSRIIENMLLLRTDILGLTWTLQVELIAIPLVFTVTVIGLRYGIGLPVAATSLLIVLSFGPRMWGLLSDGTVLRHLFCFAIGCLVALGREALTGRMTGTWVAPILIVSAFGFFSTRPLLGYGSQWSLVFEAAFSAAIIGILAYGPALSARRALEKPAARFLGQISFSFYLLHPLPLFAIYSFPPMLDTGLPGVVVAFGLFVASVVVILPLAWVSWRFVEVPSTRLARHLFGSAHPAADDGLHR
jgi:peptidoglycan/LPS O-acetylase OafA/YrhL